LNSNFDVAAIIAMGCQNLLPENVAAAYNAPFQDDTYKAGARIFPSLVPVAPEDPASPANRKAWKVLSNCDIPLV
jgi:haloalkane dehalogenase